MSFRVFRGQPSGMNFILKMAWRDTRASRRRLLLYSLSIVLGVAALIGISSLGDSLRAAVDAQAKGLLGADLSASSRQKFSEPTLTRLRAAGGRGSPAPAWCRVHGLGRR